MIVKVEKFNSDPKHYESYERIMQEIWPKIILQSEVVGEYYQQLFKLFPDFQKVCLNQNNEVIGFINTIPIYWDKPLNELPEEGWDWLIQKGIIDHKNGLKPNHLGGLQVGIAKKHQGQGLSKKIIAIGKSLQQENNFKNFILPIRPTLKHRYPKMSMEDYIQKKNEGKIFDPWIRIHCSGGAKIIKVCHRSMVITGSIEEWETWSGNQIKKSGLYLFDGALNATKIDIKSSKNSYVEANLWVHYKYKSSVQIIDFNP